MRKRWLALAFLAAIAPFALTLTWPVRPLWQASFPQEVKVLGFNDDGRELLVVSGFDNDNRYYYSPPSAGKQPALHRLDSATGRATAAPLPLALPDENGHHAVASPDGRHLIVFRNTWPTETVLIATETGATTALPGIIKFDIDLVDPTCFSPDSRWFWMYDIIATRPNEICVGIHDAHTGQPVLQLPSFTNYWPGKCQFAPDGSAVAVLRLNHRTATVEIWELPSGELRRQFTLPRGRSWFQFVDWKVDRLIINALNLNNHFESVSFDPNSADIGVGHQEPLRIKGRNRGQNYWASGSGWIVLIDRNPPLDKTLAAQTWLASRTGWVWLTPQVGYQLAFFDNDQPRSTRLPSLKYPQCVSRNGRRVASSNASQVEVWDAAPDHRWPWALLAGGVAALPALLVGRWRSKR